jgi:cyclopropane-fatty-acyl-phospholipid synthase
MSSYLPTIVTKPLSQGTDLLRSTLGSISFGPALSLSKTAVVSLFSKIEAGTLVVTDLTTGTTRSYGQKIAKEHKKATNGINGVNGRHAKKKTGKVSKVELLVKKETFWVRLFLFADMGFAEAYMLGEVECTDLTGFFKVSYLGKGIDE